MGPRSIERGNLNRAWTLTTSPVVLQWGRAQSSAEIPRTHPGTWNCRLPASMGPRSIERGNPAYPTTAQQQAQALQWGRAQSSAEIPPQAVGHVAPALGFNGAALNRARKCGGGGGRGFDHYAASMGPRSIERGNPSASDPGRSTPGRRFNGAALNRARKFIVVPYFLAGCTSASMGPRSIERGNATSGLFYGCGL